MKLQTQHLYQQLAELRQSKNVSQRELAHQLRLPQSYISRVETGKVDIGLANFIDLVRYFDSEVMVVPKHLVPTVTALMAPDSVPKTQKPRWALANTDDESEEL